MPGRRRCCAPCDDCAGPPRVVLDEWLRLRLVRLDEHDRVCLDGHGVVPSRESEEMFYFPGRNVHDQVAAAVHNVLGDGPPFLERSMNDNNPSADAVAELQDAARTRGLALLRDLNARALRLRQRDAGKPDATRRVNVGLYTFSEDQRDDEEPEG